MYKGAVFFDYDGTLVDETEHIFEPTQQTIKAIEMLKSNHYLVGIATGRSKCYIPQSSIDFDCYITTNGAYVEIDSKPIQNIIFDNQDIKRLLDYLENNDYTYVVEEQDTCYVQNLNHILYKKMMKIFQIDTKHFVTLNTIDGLTINKVVVMYHSKKQLDTLITNFGQQYDITSHRSVNSSDISQKNISKASGIGAVIKHCHLDIKNTYAFGDGDNDYDMLKSVGTGIAMGVHSPSLKEVCNYTAGTVKEEGIFNTLKHFDLI